LALFATTPAGVSTPLTTVKTQVGADEAQLVATLAATDVPEGSFLTYRYTGSDGTQAQDHFMLRPYKAYDLVAPEVTLTSKATEQGYEITLSSQALALFVALEASVAGKFSQNAVTLTPDSPLTLTFTPKPDVADGPVDFSVMDLHSATYGTS
jgi:beta-mannosidase